MTAAVAWLAEGAAVGAAVMVTAAYLLYAVARLVQRRWSR